MNSSACAEVYQIIQYLPEEEYRLIPKEKIDYIKKNSFCEYICKKF